MTAHEQAKEMMMTDPVSLSLPKVDSRGLTPSPKTDAEIIEERAQTQFAKILEQKREHELTEKITARIHELARAAGLKPQDPKDLLQFMVDQRTEAKRRAALEQHADKLAEREHAAWLAKQRKVK